MLAVRVRLGARVGVRVRVRTRAMVRVGHVPAREKQCFGLVEI